ncbi:hypothetical protein [Clostridium tertium]|uniref:Inhibitor of sigma-G Gin n=1 Tax=Clostridium tertium TaxID=1559 RepID=A0A6N3CKL8_9CLOT
MSFKKKKMNFKIKDIDKNTCIVCSKELVDDIINDGCLLCQKCTKETVSLNASDKKYEYYKEKIKRWLISNFKI